MDYFSDKEQGSKQRTTENITTTVWGGIVALIQRLLDSGAFGEKYPQKCEDGGDIIGNDEHVFSLAIQAEIPAIEWPLKTVRQKEGRPWENEPVVPDTNTVLDVIQFCYQSVAKPITRNYHDFLRHSHLHFDEQAGKEEFLVNINKIFERNGIAFILKGDGSIERMVSPVIQEFLSLKR